MRRLTVHVLFFLILNLEVYLWGKLIKILFNDEKLIELFSKSFLAQTTCKNNQEFNKCASNCGITCEDSIAKKTSKKCIEKCVPKCVCKNGFMMNTKGECVQSVKCQSIQFFRKYFNFC